MVLKDSDGGGVASAHAEALTTARGTGTNRPKSTRFWPQCWRLKWENKIILMLITSGLYFFRSECKNTIFVAVSAMEIKENNT